MGSELELEPDLGEGADAAVAQVLADEGLLAAPESAGLGAWRRTGLEEAVDREPQARSPRSTRGATRA